MPFTMSAALFGLLLALGAYTFGIGVCRWTGLDSRLPRARIAGEILGVVCLIWAAYHVCPMLEGGMAKYRTVVKLLVPVVAALGYFHLDFLFARALGGFMLLCLNALLHGAFAARVPLRGGFSTLCYVLSVGGFILTASPWRLRDLLAKCETSTAWRRGWGVGLGLASVAFLAYALAG